MKASAPGRRPGCSAWQDGLAMARRLGNRSRSVGRMFWMMEASRSSKPPILQTSAGSLRSGRTNARSRSWRIYWPSFATATSLPSRPVSPLRSPKTVESKRRQAPIIWRAPITASCSCSTSLRSRTSAAESESRSSSMNANTRAWRSSGSSPTISAPSCVGSLFPLHVELVADEPPTAAVHDRLAAHPTCPVLQPPVGGELLDFDSLSADPRAHRATRVASDLSWATAPGSTGMSSRECHGGGVFGKHGRSDQSQKQRVAQAPEFTGMTVVDELGRVDELASSVDAVTGAAIGPYRESQFELLTLLVPGSRSRSLGKWRPHGLDRWSASI